MCIRDSCLLVLRFTFLPTINSANFLLVVFFIFGYSFNYLINSETNEEEITNYLENHPEEIENLIDIAEEILIDKRNEIQKNIIDQSKLFLENQKLKKEGIVAQINLNTITEDNGSTQEDINTAQADLDFINEKIEKNERVSAFLARSFNSLRPEKAEEIAGDVHSPVALVEVHPTHERMEMTLVWLNENRPIDYSNDGD